MEVTQELDKKALSIANKLSGITAIANHEEYTHCGELWEMGRSMMKEIDNGYDDIISSLHKVHKDAIAKKAAYYTPVYIATKRIKGLMGVYDAEQEQIRKNEEKRLQEIARKAEEARVLQEAIQAEAAGDISEADAIISTPVYVPPVVIPKTVPKLAGGPVFRTIWKYRILNIAAIPRGYLIPDEVKIGQVVRALKRETSIPGIEVYEERA